MWRAFAESTGSLINTEPIKGTDGQINESENCCLVVDKRANGKLHFKLISMNIFLVSHLPRNQSSNKCRGANCYISISQIGIIIRSCKVEEFEF